MKKIIVALGVVAIAAGVQAASFNWTSSGTASGKTINSVAGTALYSSTTAYTLYLFDAAVVSQESLLAGLRADSTKTLADFTSVKSQTLASNSQITATEFSYGAADTEYSFYFAVINGEDVFLSASKAAYGQASATTSVSFSGNGTATKNAFADTTATFAANGAGWYSVAPEPTSGLLLLLGMAGLALKRKRA